MIINPRTVSACRSWCDATQCSDPACDDCSYCVSPPGGGVNIRNKFGSIWYGAEDGGKGFADLVSVILSNALVVSGLIILFMFIFAGISIILGAGSGDTQAAARGKQTATAAVIGFLIIFGAYWIIQIVEKITGLKILNPPL